MRITLFGTRDSAYTRIVKFVLNAKSLDYNFVAADFFTGDGLPKDHARRHPFKRIPAIEADGRAFYETDAIAHYLDQIVPDPAPVPVDAVATARMRQIVRIPPRLEAGGTASAGRRQW
jgi:glutathione S-transferase